MRSQTLRGFAVYDEFIDRNGQKIRIQESSLATESAAWIFVGEPVKGAAHLTVEMARLVRDALDEFIKERVPS